MIGQEKDLIRHKHYVVALEKLLTIAIDISHHDEGAIIQLVGAARAGKTQLLNEFRANTEKAPDNDAWATNSMGIAHSCRMPLVAIEANPGHFTKGRKEEDHFFLNIVQKLLPESDRRMLIDAGLGTDGGAIAHEFKKRGVRWLVIDEAHHLMYVKSDRRQREHAEIRKVRMETLKTLVNESGVVLILAGGPLLLSTRFLAEQFGARCRTIPINLYQLDNVDDAKEYLDHIVPMLQMKKSLCERHTPEEFALQLMVGYAGSIGLTARRIQEAVKHNTSLTDVSTLLDPNVRDTILESDQEIRKLVAPQNLLALVKERLHAASEKSKSCPRAPNASPAKKRSVGKQYDKRQEIGWSITQES